MVLTRIVSPPGNHSVRIVSSTREESAVSYSITTADPGTGKDFNFVLMVANKTQWFSTIFSILTLEVILTGGSPLVTESSVEAEFVTTRPVTGVRCFLRYENKNDYKDCKDKLFITRISIFMHVLRFFWQSVLY